MKSKIQTYGAVIAALLLTASFIVVGCTTPPTPTTAALIKGAASEGVTIDVSLRPKDRPYFVTADGVLVGIEGGQISLGALESALHQANLASNTVPIVAVSLQNALDLINAQVATNAAADVTAYVTPLEQGIAQGLTATASAVSQ